jgi:ubiquinone/menaquinone biosynthesis C-methylase UbiE
LSAEARPLRRNKMQNADVKTAMRKIWDESAPTYDSRPGHGIRSEKEKQAWQDLLCSSLPTDKCDLLDVGCGTGVMALLLAEMGHVVTGVDISETMLERAREKAAQLDLSVEFKIGDAEELPFEGSTFDVVISRHVLWALPNPEKAVAEWKRVLRPGGRVIVIDGNWGANGSLFHRGWRFFGQLLVLITEQRNPWPRWRYKGIERELPMRQRERPEADIAILKDMGFEEIEVMDVKIPRTRTFLEFLKYGHWAGEFLVEGVKVVGH